MQLCCGILRVFTELKYGVSDVQYKSKSSSKAEAKRHFDKRSVLIMDEVDGMSSGDRGGIAELITLIKTSRVCVDIECLTMTKLNFWISRFWITDTHNLYLQ